MNKLQTSGGVSALIAAGTYLFAMGLAVSILKPMVDNTLGFEEYMVFLTANKYVVFLWNFFPYLINGSCLVVLVLAIHERLKIDSPHLARIASVFGLIWSVFIFLSGFILIHSTQALITIYQTNPAQAEVLKNMFEILTSSIDSSDKFLGCLWVGLISLAAFKKKTFPVALDIFGLVISSIGLIGTTIPSLVSISYIFGIGAIFWWLGIGIYMLRKQQVQGGIG